MRSPEYNQFISQLGATTRVLNAEIKKQIIDVKAVRTGRMKNNTKVKIEYNDEKQQFTIFDVNSTFYYIYIDGGTKNADETWRITPRKITDKTMDRDRVIRALDKLYDVWIDWMIAREFEVIR
jgi:hypothetical protein